jgi:uncharacterized YccA/Bax inhibitor family protein
MAQLRSSNPVFTKGGLQTTGTPPETPSAEELSTQFRAPSSLTIDDVIIHTVGLFAIVGVTGAIGWALSSDSNMGVGLAAGLAALALSFAIAFRRTIAPALIIVFAVLEGLFVGAISHIYEQNYSGIVLQAMLGTAAVFLTMLFAYRMRWLRATPRMRRVVWGSLMGVVALGLLDLVVRLFSGSHLPIINDATPLGILFSVAVLIVASLQFVLDFDYIEKAIAAGAPREEAWRASYGLLVGFVWVYLEMLRLLSKLRG